jgi:NADH-quinone oxidoreductase subunit M
MTGPKPEGLVGEREHDRLDESGRRGLTAVRDLTTREKLVAAPLIAAFVVLGFLPNIALNVINPAVDQTLSHVQKAIPNLNPAGTVAEGSSK